MSETLGKEENAFKAYLKKIFSKKQLITKAIILAAAILIVVIPAASFYAAWSGKSGTIYEGGLINIIITWNPGIATSAMSGNVAGIYAIQSVVFVLLLGIYLFLVQDKVSCSFVALALVGGFFNLIQRACAPAAHANCVFDYIQFSKPWLQWMSLGPNIFNWPDMGVVIGIIGFIISYIVYVIKQVVKDKKEEDKITKQAKAYEESKTEKK